MEAGINTPARVDRPGVSRLPVVLIRTSPHKARDEVIPWHDHFDLDLGRIDYYGDNRAGGRAAEDAPGNRSLLAETRLHLSPESEDRLWAAPLMVFRSVSVDGRVKGQVRFEGLAVIEACEKIVQVDCTGARYDNFRFRLALIDLGNDRYRIGREWLADRRNGRLDASAANRHAPDGRRDWVDGASIDEVRATAKPRRPRLIEASAFGPDHERILDRLDQRYRADPAGFTMVSVGIVEFLYRSVGHRYATQQVAAADGRFSGRVSLAVTGIGDIAEVMGFVVKQNRAARLSARAVAELTERARAGTFPVVVTREVIPLQDHDRFDQLVVDGRRIAQTLLQLTRNQNSDLDELLDRLEAEPGSVIGSAVSGQARVELPSDLDQ